MPSRKRCNSRNTVDGRRCRNWADTCPYAEHRRPAHPQAPENVLEASRYAAEAAAFAAVPTTGPARSLPPDIRRDLTRLIVEDTSLRQDQIEKDYWLHAGLHRLAARDVGEDTAVALSSGRWRRPRHTRFDVLFGGGTALVSQWGLSERFSEDIDLLIVGRTAMPGSDRLRQASIWVANLCASAMTEPAETERQPTAHAPHPLHIVSHAERRGRPEYAKVDVVEASVEMSPWVPRTVMSLMGRYACDNIRREHPELGGFSLPSLHFAVTIGNKMRANVENAEHGRNAKLTERARDLFDIASAASDSDARNEILAHMRKSVIDAETRNDTVGQRARLIARFPMSPALQMGTPQYEALQRGYRHVIESLAWRPDSAPSFDDAIELARGLRLD
ncbi:nucleotidyl transferase AbiEii/AbiGii toxin family protein [Candidatus Poriferisodalis sp.]|uniref:nucleotidyl transferase AbiEii/AbiGii toxin family protein n=1 Tax=Candidatus Poriferisodalis sp. TaxID=3101277 RepID=UPI003B021D8A